MAKDRKLIVKHPDAKPGWRRDLLFQRAKSSGLQFLAISDLARGDAAQCDGFSKLTPAVIMLGHKLADDLLSDLVRAMLNVIHESRVEPWDQRTKEEVDQCGRLLKKALGSGTEKNLSKLDEVLSTFPVEVDLGAVSGVKALCDLRDVLFHDDGLPTANHFEAEDWRNCVLKLSESLNYKGPTTEEEFMQWDGLIGWVLSYAGLRK